jgi:hypothetical protein
MAAGKAMARKKAHCALWASRYFQGLMAHSARCGDIQQCQQALNLPTFPVFFRRYGRNLR